MCTFYARRVSSDDAPVEAPRTAVIAAGQYREPVLSRHASFEKKYMYSGVVGGVFLLTRLKRCVLAAVLLVDS